MRTIVLSGSGLSAESGIPTFADDLYAGLDAASILTSQTLRTQPEIINAVCDRLRLATGAAQPNAAHWKLGEFDRDYGGVFNFTQNVDDLLERAGCTHVVHLHGLITRMRCLGRAHACDIGYVRDPDARCSRCRSRLRPDVVLFGETSPAYRALRRALADATSEDALIVVGTRGEVLPVNDMARRFPGKRAFVNLEPSPFIEENVFDVVRYGRATEELPGVLDSMLSK